MKAVYAIAKDKGINVHPIIYEKYGTNNVEQLTVKQASELIDYLKQEGEGGGIMTHFDTETSVVPCHHEELIEEFCESTGGRLTIECPVQIWRRRNDKDYDSPYVVQFIQRDRLVRFEAENFGDYYDVESVVLALNRVLEDSSQPERFIGLYTGDQCACFVFADPARFLPIANKYGLPLSEDTSDAMRAGMGYEQQVLTQHIRDDD